MAVAVAIEQALTAKFSVLLPHLDERQRRLYLGSWPGRWGMAASRRWRGRRG